MSLNEGEMGLYRQFVLANEIDLQEGERGGSEGLNTLNRAFDGWIWSNYTSFDTFYNTMHLNTVAPSSSQRSPCTAVVCLQSLFHHYPTVSQMASLVLEGVRF